MSYATVIGPQTRVAGPLYAKDDLVIEGTVEGPVHGEANVKLGLTANVGSNVRGRDVEIAGKLDHNVHADGTVHLLASAQVSGDIDAPRIAIDEGAVFEGRVTMRRSRSESAHVPTVTPAPPTATATAASPTAPPPRLATPVTAPAAPPSEARERTIPVLASPGRKRLIRKPS